MEQNKKTCPCCGYKTLEREEDDTCTICFWDDNLVQEHDPDSWGGPNTVSLRLAQLNYKEFGACEKDRIKNVRKPHSYDVPDLSFEPLKISQHRLWDKYKDIMRPDFMNCTGDNGNLICEINEKDLCIGSEIASYLFGNGKQEDLEEELDSLKLEIQRIENMFSNHDAQTMAVKFIENIIKLIREILENEK